VRKFKTLVLVICIALLATACGTSGNSSDSSAESQLVTDWKAACSADPKSDACSEYVLNLDLYFETIGYSVGTRQMLMADMYAMGLLGEVKGQIGNLYCDPSNNNCWAPLVILNTSTSPFSSGFMPELIGSQGTFASNRADCPDILNPSTECRIEVNFKVGKDLNGFHTLLLKDSGLEKERVEISLCRQPDEDGYVVYGNCLRLLGYEYSDRRFTKTIANS